jgi:hypothetical protein
VKVILAQKKHSFRLPLLIIGFVLLVLGLAAFRLFFLEAWLAQKIRQQVQAQSRGLYALHFKTLEASLLTGNLKLDSVSLVPDFALWQSRHKNAAAQLPPLLYQVQAGHINFSGINYMGLLRQKPLRLNRLRLRQARLVITRMKADTSSGPLHRKLTGPWKGFSIGQIDLQDGSLVYKKQGARESILAMNQIALQVRNLQLDSQAFADKERFYYARQVKVTAGKADFLLVKGDYRLKTGTLVVNTASREISMQRARLVPLASAAQMARRHGKAINYFQVSVPRIRLEQVQFPAISRQGAFYAGQLTIDRARLYIYTDAKHYPAAGRKPLLQELVRQVKPDFQIKKARLRGINLRYEELAPKAHKLAYLTIRNMNLSITNFSNNKTLMTARTPLVVRGSLSLMGQAPIRATLRMNILDPRGYHTIQGTIGKGQPAILNPFMEPGHLVRVKSGTVHHGDFRMVFTRDRATGTMHLTYDNFKVDLLSEETEKEARSPRRKQSLGKKILSVVANKAILNSNNMPDTGRYKTGTINTQRRETGSTFTFWIDGLTSGTRSIMGLDSQVPAS